MEGEAQQRAWGGGRPRSGGGSRCPMPAWGRGRRGSPRRLRRSRGSPVLWRGTPQSVREAAARKHGPANVSKAECRTPNAECRMRRVDGCANEVRALRMTQDLTLRNVDLEPILGLGRPPPTPHQPTGLASRCQVLRGSFVWSVRLLRLPGHSLGTGRRRDAECRTLNAECRMRRAGAPDGGGGPAACVGRRQASERRREPLPDPSLGEGTSGVPTHAAVKSGRPGPLAPNAATYEGAAPKQEPANEGKAEC